MDNFKLQSNTKLQFRKLLRGRIPLFCFGNSRFWRQIFYLRAESQAHITVNELTFRQLSLLTWHSYSFSVFLCKLIRPLMIATELSATEILSNRRERQTSVRTRSVFHSENGLNSRVKLYDQLCGWIGSFCCSCWAFWWQQRPEEEIRNH